jgi:hypothetical protein
MGSPVLARYLADPQNMIVLAAITFFYLYSQEVIMTKSDRSVAAAVQIAAQYYQLRPPPMCRLTVSKIAQRAKQGKGILVNWLNDNHQHELLHAITNQKSGIPDQLVELAELLRKKRKRTKPARPRPAQATRPIGCCQKSANKGPSSVVQMCATCGTKTCTACQLCGVCFEVSDCQVCGGLGGEPFM